ncbi:Uncharacterized protein HZ326_17432 [Fusarium oxysporum f. sp. albedinis]|nr:Uncharacterized protein HZ326_17432 [Fusarium oxysporum f. sp. albedinis]
MPFLVKVCLSIYKTYWDALEFPSLFVVYVLTLAYIAEGAPAMYSCGAGPSIDWLLIFTPQIPASRRHSSEAKGHDQ